MSAYYNEIDPYAAQWLRNLIKKGHIAPGEVDERSIVDVTPQEIKLFTQCHFFAGIGIWSHALRGAGFADGQEVWTGSCPCQPFSAAGKAGGFDDERHLWPHWHHLIRECRPAIVFGEQVASKDGLGWLDLVQSDLEGSAFAVGAVDTCAAGFGAPHWRQRLYWVAERLGDTSHQSRERNAGGISGAETPIDEKKIAINGGEFIRSQYASPSVGRLADTNGGNASKEREQRGEEHGQLKKDGENGDGHECPGEVKGFWRDCDWLFCTDGKWRPVEPGSFPLANGVASRMGRLRAYGNGLAAPQAQGFIEAYMECRT